MSTPDQLFKPVLPSERVGQFLTDHPNFEPHSAIDFLLDNFPQMDDQGVVWILEGGLAVDILTNGRRQAVTDIDVVSRNGVMQSEFGCSYFDIKSVESWLAAKGLPSGPQPTRQLLASSVPITFMGRTLVIMRPDLIAAGKSYDFLGRPPRDKDKRDIALLGILDSDLEIARRQLSSSS